MYKKSIKRWPIVVILIILSITYAWNEYNRKQKSTLAIDAFATTTASTLVKEFEVDETAANKKYNDKVIVVNGIIQTIEIADSTLRIVLKGEAGGVIGELEKSEREKAIKLKVGDSLKLKGVCTGYLMDVILVRTIIIN